MSDNGMGGMVPSPHTPTGEDPDSPESVPPGGEGADSGSADAVGIDPAESGEVANESSMNDAAGVGTRDPDGPPPSTERTQDEPLLAQNVATDDEKIDGIIAQTAADVPGAPLARVADVIDQRLHDSAIPRSREQIEEYASRVLALWDERS